MISVLARAESVFRVKSFIRNMTTKAAVCQFTATNDKVRNFSIVERLVSSAAQQKAQIVFLPEGCDYIAKSSQESNALAEGLNGESMRNYKALARKYGVWLSLGGFHECTDEKYYNAHILLSSEGKIVALYRKIHLFNVNIPEKNINLQESSYISPGEEIVAPVNTPIGSVALSICYDVRFPELSTVLRKMGAEILTYPSAFIHTTGKSHWEVLLRARAIENQCYVIAAAQYGQHNDKRISHGQAMIVDPWGQVVAQCPPYTEDVPVNESVVVADIDRDYLEQVRREMPVFSHRRQDKYQLISCVKKDLKSKDNYLFSDKVILASTVFYATNHCYAFTNIRCVVPGHVLVASTRQARRLTKLEPEEIADFFQAVVKVQRAVEKVYGVNSSTVCVQDGEDAGQTISHVHCHILPRKQGDFKRNDDVYLELAKHDREDTEKPIRKLEEMIAEADILRAALH